MATTKKEPNASSTSFSTTHVSPSKLQSKITNTVQVFADYSVWDTVANKYLTEGKDFDAKDLHRI